MLVEDILITERGLLGLAEVRSDGVTRDAVDVGRRISNHSPVLYVEPSNLGETAGVGDELGNDRHLGLGVDCLAGSEVALVAHAVRVEVAAVRIAGTGVAGAGVSSAAVVPLAHGLGGRVARMRRQGRGDAVRLPDVELSAAGSVVSDAGVGVVVRRYPAFGVTLVD